MACASQLEVSDQLVQAVEERLAHRFEDAIAELAANIERTEAKVDFAIAPLLQSLSLASIDTRRDIARLDTAILETQYGEDQLLSTVGDAIASLNTDLTELQSKCSFVLMPLMPLMQTIALDHMDAKTRLDGLESADRFKARLDKARLDSVGLRLDSLGGRLDNLESADLFKARLDSLGGAGAVSTARLESLEMQIEDFAARQSLGGPGAATTSRLESLEMQIEDIAARQGQPVPGRQECGAQTQAVAKEVAVQTTQVATPSNSVPACMLDLAPQLGIHEPTLAHDARVSPSGSGGGPLTPFQQVLLASGGKRPAGGHPAKQHALAQQGRSSEKEASGKSSSKRHHRGEKPQGAEWCDPLSPSFARGGSTIGSRAFERSSGARSLPYLPPMF